MPPPNGPQRSGSLWPHRSRLGTTKGCASFTASSNFYLSCLPLAGARANEASKSYRRTLLPSHPKGHIPNLLITSFLFWNRLPFIALLALMLSLWSLPSNKAYTLPSKLLNKPAEQKRCRFPPRHKWNDVMILPPGGCRTTQRSPIMPL